MITSCLLMILAMAFSPDTQRRHERILRRAIVRSVETMQRASQEAEIDKAQFTRQVQMLEGSHKRLAMLPDDFWRWYAVEIASEFGLPAELDTARRLDRAVRSTDAAMEIAS